MDFGYGLYLSYMSTKEWSFKFEEVDGGVVYMGSGDVSYITMMGQFG